MCAVLVVFSLAPLFMILVKSVEDRNGAFVGLLQFREYLSHAVATAIDIEHRVGRRLR